MNETVQRTEMEQVHEDAVSPEVSVEAKPDSTDAQELQNALDEVAEGFRVGGFKCAHQECSLVHEHDTTKHRASDDFDMSDDEAASMEANPNCHCGLNELARRGVEDAPSPEKANNMAPIPGEMSRHLDSMF